MFVFAAVVFDRLPEQVPSHWNMQGEVDDTMARWPGAFLTPDARLEHRLLQEAACLSTAR